jgi:FAD/FMN-containing dehydrogenase/Fe-S oxidoreductase
VPVLARGAGTSQCGQTVGAALVIDTSRYLNRLIAFDADRRLAVVQPGMVLDRLNALLKPSGLWFPVDVSTSAQATLGGMAGNNSCGSRSVVYGNMVHNVLGIDAVLADGSEFHFGPEAELAGAPAPYRDLVARIHAIVEREKDEIARRWPNVLRHVQGYNLDMVRPNSVHNLAHLLVGSEGTLAWSQNIHLKLSALPRHKSLGVCHFDSFYQAMQAPQHIVGLAPAAVELVDATMIALARGNPAFRPTTEKFVRGEPKAILLVEFAGDERGEPVQKLKRLTELMADLGHPDSVIEITDGALQRDVWEVRKAGLNIMMSKKGEGKPVSFIEDCAVPLEHLAEYTDSLSQVFARHGTEGTWYAHASVGTLHVRPILNMKDDGAQKMRAIAEEACELVRRFKGSAYSGEHGDGLVRSEWIEPILGARLTAALAEIKDLFDPKGLMNPGKIVRAPKQDDRTLFRYKPGYAIAAIETALDWSEWDTAAAASRGAISNGASSRGPKTSAASSRGFGAAVEMCNNNGYCRKFDSGTMCPSFRATGEEQHLTRGRANTLRLALSGQLGPGAFTSEAMFDTMDLCVSCKGCRRECPTGVDMAKMKIEFLHHYRRRHGYSMKDKLFAYLPRYAPWAARLAWLFNLRDAVPGLARLTEWMLGLSAKRSLPRWRGDTFLGTPHPNPLAASRGEGPQPDSLSDRAVSGGRANADSLSPNALGERARVRGQSDREVVLLPDCFNNYFEPENSRAALRVLGAAGYRVHVARAPGGEHSRPLCCGRTFLSAGMVDEARCEAQRVLEALAPFVNRGVPVVGLEPACQYTLRDEFQSLLPGTESNALAARALLLEEFLAAEAAAGRLDLPLKALENKRVLLHGHCHQKAFGALPAVERMLALVPGLAIDKVESSCCGMAGSFGYEAKHYDISMRMAEDALLPAVRKADSRTLVVADGTSCRRQIHDGAHREAIHVARLLERALL